MPYHGLTKLSVNIASLDNSFPPWNVDVQGVIQFSQIFSIKFCQNINLYQEWLLRYFISSLHNFKR